MGSLAGEMENKQTMLCEPKHQVEEPLMTTQHLEGVWLEMFTGRGKSFYWLAFTPSLDGMAWDGMAWDGMVWYSMVWCSTRCSESYFRI